MRDWDSYKKLYDELLARDFKPNPKIEHRLHRGAAMVDLIAYGSQIAPDGKLIWPESGMTMTVTGFDEVCAAARMAAKSKSTPVPVMTPKTSSTGCAIMPPARTTSVDMVLRGRRAQSMRTTKPPGRC